MATYTTFLNLEKPSTSERLDVLKINSNWDKIDAGVSALNSQKVNITLVTIDDVSITANTHTNKTLSFGQTFTGIKGAFLVKSPNVAWVFGSVQEWSTTQVVVGMFNSASSDVTGAVIVGVIT